MSNLVLNEKSALIEAFNTKASKASVGTLSDLNTTVKTSIVESINEEVGKLTQLSQKVGNIDTILALVNGDE